MDLVSIAQNTGGPTPLPCCFLHLLPASAAATWSSFLPAWPGGPRADCLDILVSFDLSHFAPTANSAWSSCRKTCPPRPTTPEAGASDEGIPALWGRREAFLSACARGCGAEELRLTLQRLAEEYSAQIADTDLETYSRKEVAFN